VAKLSAAPSATGRARPLLLTALLLVFINVAAALIYTANTEYPAIQGVFLPQPVAIAQFELVDHLNRRFTQQDLLGRWHLVSYGYTSCPDICPTTLAQVARALEQLQTRELRVLFYSVDPARDQPERLAAYVPYFHSEFLGLTGAIDASDGFSQSLGMASEIGAPETPGGAYAVAHGVVLYLLNPQGELQAVLKPANNRAGGPVFDATKIAQDILKVRSHVDRL
jgi:protein SCO1